MRTIAATALVIVGFLTFHSISAAQGLGTVAGSVKDKAGAVLPGVTVRVASAELVERVRTTVTDAGGQYRVGNLPAGLYTVTFSLTGFSPVTRLGVEVSAGLTLAINAEMTVGFPNERVTMPGQTPLVNIPSAAQMLRPYVLCGLTIVPADPRVDANIRVPFGSAESRPSVQGRTVHSMRTIAPQICADK